MKTLNTTLKYLGIALFTIGLSACASTKTQESTGEYIDNAAITTNVKAAFMKDKHIKSLPINVKTYKGEVQLSGFVDDRTQAVRAESIARRIEGVQNVQNDLILK